MKGLRANLSATQPLPLPPPCIHARPVATLPCRPALLPPRALTCAGRGGQTRPWHCRRPSISCPHTHKMPLVRQGVLCAQLPRRRPHLGHGVQHLLRFPHVPDRVARRLAVGRHHLPALVAGDMHVSAQDARPIRGAVAVPYRAPRPSSVFAPARRTTHGHACALSTLALRAVFACFVCRCGHRCRRRVQSIGSRTPTLCLHRPASARFWRVQSNRKRGFRWTTCRRWVRGTTTGSRSVALRA